MSTEALSYQLQYATLKLIFSISSEATHEGPWVRWRDAVRAIVKDDFEDVDLKVAIRRLSAGGMVRLTKTGIHITREYSGNEADDARFFFQGFFRVTATANGRSYWDRIKGTEQNALALSNSESEAKAQHV